MKTYSDRKIVLIVGGSFLLGGICMARVMTAGVNSYSIPKDNTMVSYEYTTECRCGGTIEGYQSLVDGYNTEECKKCGYHKE